MLIYAKPRFCEIIERFNKVLLGMIIEIKMMKNCSVFHIEQKMEFEFFNCFFIGFLRESFGRIKLISTVVERKYTPDIT